MKIRSAEDSLLMRDVEVKWPSHVGMQKARAEIGTIPALTTTVHRHESARHPLDCVECNLGAA